MAYEFLNDTLPTTPNDDNNNSTDPVWVMLLMGCIAIAVIITISVFTKGC